MSDDNSTEVFNENTEQVETDPEPKQSTSTVPDTDEVQSFCAEFHIKVENAVGIHPWLQFSDTNFPGNWNTQRKPSAYARIFCRRSFETI